LADFLVEFCNIPEVEELPKKLTWVVFVDGSLAQGRSGIGVLLRNPEGQEFGFAIKLDFVTTNNEAEYEAVIAGLALSREMGATNVEIRSDSQVVVGQVQGQFEAQEDRMARYLDQVRQFQSYFERVIITKIPRDENIRADEFSKIASGIDEEIEASRRQSIILTEPLITPKTNVMEADTTPNEPEWATEIIQFLRNGLLPEDKVAALKVKTQATRFYLFGEVLYKRGYSEPLLKCLSKTEVDYGLKEIHEDVCGNHSGGRMLAQKTIRAGYYWPTISKDSALLVKTCDKCQRFSRIMKTSPKKLTLLTSPWHLRNGGLDIVGPMPVGKGGRKFLVVAVDYFTKWAEAEALAAITTTNITSFLWKSVVCRFEIPHAFFTDNGKQFDCEPFRRWCLELRIRNYYASVLYPKANSQVEETNKTLVRTLKKKLEKKKGAWVDYVPEVLWSYRTTRRTPTGKMPFSLTYGTEAVIPVDVGSPSFRVAYYNPGLNDEKAKLHLYLLQEKREDAQVT
jgi:ribonuclease HI